MSYKVHNGLWKYRLVINDWPGQTLRENEHQLLSF